MESPVSAPLSHHHLNLASTMSTALNEKQRPRNFGSEDAASSAPRLSSPEMRPIACPPLPRKLRLSLGKRDGYDAPRPIGPARQVPSVAAAPEHASPLASPPKAPSSAGRQSVTDAQTSDGKESTTSGSSVSAASPNRDYDEAGEKDVAPARS